MFDWLSGLSGARVRRFEHAALGFASRTTRADFMGRCIRLLGSVYHTRLKDAVGEMLFAACDSDGEYILG